MRAINFNENGEPSHIATYAMEEDLIENEGVRVLSDLSDEEALETFYLSKSKEVKRRTPRPSIDHKWDPDAELWWEDLAAARESALESVDNKAEIARMRFVTAGFGQSMTYEAKYQEALVGDGPFLRAEAQALEMTVAEVASSVLTARDQWETLGAAIEAARLKAKKQIRAAGTAAEMHAVAASLFAV